MPYCCYECGNTKEFRGYEEYTAWGTERCTFNGEGNAQDYTDSEENEREQNETHVEECIKCNSNNIEYLEGEKFEEWKEKFFDEECKFIKEGVKKGISGGFINPIHKLNDLLLKGEITVGEHRRKIEIIRKM